MRAKEKSKMTKKEIAVATTWLRKDRGNKKWDSSVANAPSRMTRGKAE